LRAVRNTWLYPLVCIVFGWIIRTGIFVYFGKYHAAIQFVATTFGTTLLLALAAWRLHKLPAVKRGMDFLRLQIPVVREAELRLAVVMFFSTFRLVYEAGGLAVLPMFDLALATVRNNAVREDLLKARPVLADNGALGDAFAQPALLEDEIKAQINTGSLSGQLDRCLAQIVTKATWQLELTLETFNRLFQRLVVFCVAMSIVETILLCIL
jgi:type II secretory pathway component PulF